MSSQGAQPPPQPPPGPPQPGGQQQTTAGIISLVFGILQFVVLPLVGTIVALVTGYMSRGEAERNPAMSDELGRVGRILGWIGLILTVGMIVLGLVVLALIIAFGVGVEGLALA